ncbi:hypothetical protein [Polaromonas sp. CG_9.11]|uniref:hypothetical protein n=1 Tax=Polaromonas sp. CG_9.11 TaxID=2787730 RepID=UPI0018C8DE0E|nr:hypothetical protein [Polaromonas sp. CG_9.11]MBG6074215.1 hypothetical protein [Polaromonas sp. CG_9.11]
MLTEPIFKPDVCGPPNQNRAIGAIVNFRDRDWHSLCLLSNTSRAEIMSAFRSVPELLRFATSAPLAEIAAELEAEAAMQAMNEIAPYRPYASSAQEDAPANPDA